MVFVDYEEDTVVLYRRVPGDGTKWYVGLYDWKNHSFSYWDDTIEPGDLVVKIGQIDADGISFNTPV